MTEILLGLPALLLMNAGAAGPSTARRRILTVSVAERIASDNKTFHQRDTALYLPHLYRADSRENCSETRLFGAGPLLDDSSEVRVLPTLGPRPANRLRRVFSPPLWRGEKEAR